MCLEAASEALEEMDSNPKRDSADYDALKHTKEVGLQNVIVLDPRTPEDVALHEAGWQPVQPHRGGFVAS